MEVKFSDAVKSIIALSKNEALESGNGAIGSAHLLLAIIRHGDNFAIDILQKLNVSIEDVAESLSNALRSKTPRLGLTGNITLTKEAEKVLKLSYLERQTLNSRLSISLYYINSIHLLLSILREENYVINKVFSLAAVNYETALKSITETLNSLSVQEIITRENPSFVKDDFAQLNLIKPEIRAYPEVKPEAESEIENGILSDLICDLDLNTLIPNERSMIHLEFEFPDHVSDEEAMQMIKDGILLANRTYNDLGGNGLKINDIQVTETQPEFINQ